MFINPLGILASACNIIKCSKEGKNKKGTPITTIELQIDDESIKVDFSVVSDFDWARAAWTLINVCKERGQIENLKKIVGIHNSEK